MSNGGIIQDLTSAATWSLAKDRISPKAHDLLEKLCHFVMDECIPAEQAMFDSLPWDPKERFRQTPKVFDELATKARNLGLWNLFLPQHFPQGPGLSTLEYALMAEITGRAAIVAPHAINSNAPDSGNMELLEACGNKDQQEKWLVPLMNGEIRSVFAMTEIGRSSSDATNIATTITRDGNDVVINGKKWWITGAGDPRVAIHIVFGVSDATNESKHKRHSVVLVPSNAPGLKIVRPMRVFNFDDAPEGHFEVHYENVRVPMENVVLGMGRGFEIIQRRLGPGRLHHCMRSVGVAMQALDVTLERVTNPARKTFGKTLSEHDGVITTIAKLRIQIESARMMVLSAAMHVDNVGWKAALKEVGMAKVYVPKTCQKVLDTCMQLFGAEGLSQDQALSRMFAGLRTISIVDGPTQVHELQIGKTEIKRVKARTATTSKL